MICPKKMVDPNEASHMNIMNEASYMNIISSTITTMDELVGATLLLKEIDQGCHSQKSVPKNIITNLLSTVSKNLVVDNDINQSEIPHIKYEMDGKSVSPKSCDWFRSISIDHWKDILPIGFNQTILERMYQWKKHQTIPKRSLVKDLDAMYKFLFSDMYQMGWEWKASNFVFDTHKLPPEEHDATVIFQKMNPSHYKNNGGNNKVQSESKRQKADQPAGNNSSYHIWNESLVDYLVCKLRSSNAEAGKIHNDFLPNTNEDNVKKNIGDLILDEDFPEEITPNLANPQPLFMMQQGRCPPWVKDIAPFVLERLNSQDLDKK